MGWSYSPAGPFNDTTAAGRRNRIRRRMGDTDPRRHLVEDEELDDILALNANALVPSLLDAIDQVEARFAARSDSETLPEGSVSWGGVLDRLRALRAQILVRGAPAPFLGGGSIDDSDSRDDDSDVPGWAFRQTGPGDSTTADPLLRHS